MGLTKRQRSARKAAQMRKNKVPGSVLKHWGGKHSRVEHAGDGVYDCKRSFRFVRKYKRKFTGKKHGTRTRDVRQHCRIK